MKCSKYVMTKMYTGVCLRLKLPKHNYLMIYRHQQKQTQFWPVFTTYLLDTTMHVMSLH